MVWPLKRRTRKPTAPRRGPTIQTAEQLAAQRRLLALARQRQAEHLYDGLTR